jgi:Nuclease-related domain/AAA domain
VARMIPPIVPEECKSPGEKEIFARLRDDPATKEWFVLHSLDVARHLRQVAGEIDFVIVVPEKGVLCLEVKACRELHRQGGLWYYGPVSSTESDARGPFRQVANSMHSIRERIVKRAPGLANVIFWSGVVFPYVNFAVSSEEWHEWQVIDARLFKSHPFALLVRNMLDRAREHLASTETAKWFDARTQGPDGLQAETLVQMLRPHFEFFQSPKARIQQLDEEVNRYTQEQLEALDGMEVNPRVLFEGPAGTGKTMLAIEAARRGAAAGRRVLFVCFNRLLARRLAVDTASIPSVKVCTLHRHMLDVARQEVPSAGGDEAFWTRRLPEEAIGNLLGSSADPVFDELVVDEAQDILRRQYLDFLDLSLAGGLAAGRWRFFGDFERQAIYGSDEGSLEALLRQRASSVARYSLRVNCRNTPRISELAQLLGGMSPPYRHVLRPDDGVEPVLLFYSGDDQSQKLLSSLEELYAEGFRGSDITILSARAQGACASIVNHPTWKGRIRPLGIDGFDGISYGSIHAFKGLESRAIVVTDIDRIGDLTSQALFYVATTRALHRLVILAHETVRAEARSIVKRHLEQTG